MREQKGSKEELGSFLIHMRICEEAKKNVVEAGARRCFKCHKPDSPVGSPQRENHWGAIIAGKKLLYDKVK